MYCCCFYISVISYVERVRNEKLKYTAYRGIFTVVPVPRNALSTDQQTTVIVFQKITKYKYKIVFFFRLSSTDSMKFKVMYFPSYFLRIKIMCIRYSSNKMDKIQQTGDLYVHTHAFIIFIHSLITYYLFIY
jgi:hypothetical protein